MSVRRVLRRRQDGSEREFYLVDVKVQRPDGEVVRVRKVAPIQALRAAKAYERELRQAILDERLESGSTSAAIEPRPAEPASSAPEAPPRCPTLAEFVPDFMRFQASPSASRRGANKPGELREKQRTLDNHLLPAFGALRLDEISARLIDRYVADKASPPPGSAGATTRGCVGARPLAPATIANHLILLRRILSVAHRWELIPRVPAIQCPKVDNHRLDFLTFEEADRLIAAAAPQWRLLLLLAIRTGLRLGELRALRWQDVHLAEGYLRVEESLTRAGIGTPKSGRARTVDLARDIREGLRELARRAPASGLVFANLDGSPLSAGQVYRATQAAARASGLGRPLNPHMLRHTFASHCVMRGIPLAVVKEWLGHADARMTERYAHLAPEVRAGYADRLKSVTPVQDFC